MTCPPVARLRISRLLVLAAASIVLATVVLWNDGRSGRVETAIDAEHAMIVGRAPAVAANAAEPRSTPRSVLQLAALGAVVTVALGNFARSDSGSARGPFTVGRRLAHACRRAPPTVLVPSTV